MNPDLLTDELFREWMNVAPTKAQVDAQVKLNAGLEARIARDLEIDDWLRRNPEAGCSRRIAGVLADLQKAWEAPPPKGR